MSSIYSFKPHGGQEPFKYYTLDDIEYMIYDAQDHDTEEEAWHQIKIYLFNIAALCRKYASELNDYQKIIKASRG